jgi:hypothetical protein
LANGIRSPPAVTGPTRGGGVSLQSEAVRPVIKLVVAALMALLPATHNSAAAASGHYRGFGDAGGFLNIVPPGQQGTLNGLDTLTAALGSPPKHFVDQEAMYANLVHAVPGLTDAQLGAFFKDASFGVVPGDIAATYSPTAGVTVVRDKSFGVPHIFGQTRYATMFAQGYTGAEDRLFFMDALRHVGRARLSEFLGPSPANLAMDRAQLAVAPYTDADLQKQVNAMAASGPEGKGVLDDFNAYSDGVNSYIAQALLNPLRLPAEYIALQVLPAPWTPADSVAVGSYIGSQLGRGGGRELTNLCGIDATAAELHQPDAARAIFSDLHETNDPDAPTTSSHPAPFPAGLGSVDPASQPAVNCASLKPIAGGTPSLADLLAAIRGVLPVAAVATGPFGSFSLSFPGAMSNALLVSGARSASGHPIAVMGPQTGYFAPQVLVEKDVHGPGIDARGISFPGTDAYVEMGRGANFAWSATSSGADNVDEVVLKLCDPKGGPVTTASMGALHDGSCERLDSFQHVQIAKPTLAGLPAGPNPDLILSWPVQRSARYGPLVARGTLTNGTPIAIATERSTYGAELSSALGFRRLNDPAFMAGGFPAFQRAVAGIDYTFNWFYIDTRDIGYQQSCHCPQRAAGVDPNLPTWATGPWDWTGFIPRTDNPSDLNPAAGYLTSWNNKQAPGWSAADDQFSYGPVYRSELLDHRIEAAFTAHPGGIDRAALVGAMEDAGTVDLRGEADLPLLLQALGAAPPSGTVVDSRAPALRDALASWLAAGAHRRDLHGTGRYDDPLGPAVMDAWWPLVVPAMFDAASGHAVEHLAIAVHDPPQNHIGSAFDNGMYSQVAKDLRQVLGLPVAQPWYRTYCGAGDATACQAALWRSLSAAAGALQSEFGSPAVATWQRHPADDQINFSKIGVTGVAAMEWVNRPTFQQVVQLSH